MATPAEFVAAIEARATRHETPCGTGTLVWRQWGSGPPVVLAHGGQGAWSHFIRNIEALAQNRTVIAVDLPGHGDSAMPADPPEHESMSAALALGLERIAGAGVAVDLVGFSFGASALAHMAAWYPHLARRLIVIGAGGLNTPHGHIDIGPVRGLEGAEREARLRANLLGLMLHHPESVDNLALHLLTANGRKARLTVPQLVVPDRLLRVLPQVACPVDAIWGEHDRPHPDPAAQHAVLRSVDAGAEMHVIAGAGHWAMYERADTFNAVLQKMLQQLLRSKVKDYKAL